MVKQKLPLRQCAATKEMLPKKHMLRVVRTKDKGVLLDLTGKIPGKGVYIKPTLEAYEITVKSRLLNRCLQCEVPKEIYDKLKEFCK